MTEATRTADGTPGAAVDVAVHGARIAANVARVVQGKDDVVLTPVRRAGRAGTV